MSQTLLSLAGFQVILIGRFWVIAEDWQDNYRKVVNVDQFLFWLGLNMERRFPLR
jgi:hypothetical protein